MAAKVKGTVKWFNPQKGYGFITPDEGGSDLFVHQSAIQAQGFRTLTEGQEVEYDEAEENGKNKAINVTGPDGSLIKVNGQRGGLPSRPRKWPEGMPATDGKKIGSVKWFNSDKGFGFIAPNEGGDDLFVHQSAIHAAGFRSLREGEDVEFKVIEENGQKKATDVCGPGGVAIQGTPRSSRPGPYGGAGAPPVPFYPPY